MEMLNDGILSIDETEGEEISLTAEGPQLTEEERLRIESEKEEGDDEDVKRIDLFAASEENPLNNLLIGEDGITTLFQAKDGGSPQLVKKSKDGKRPGYRGPGGYQSGQSDSASNDDQGETSSDAGFSGGNNQSGGDNQGAQGSDAGFDNTQSYEDFNQTPTADADALNMQDYLEDFVNTNQTNIEQKEYDDLPAAKKDMLEVKKKQVYLNNLKKVRKDIDNKLDVRVATQAKNFVINAALNAIPFGQIAYGLGRFFGVVPDLKGTVPTDISGNIIGKNTVTGADLGFFDPDEYPDFYADGPDNLDDDDKTVIQEIMASTDVIEERDETDIFDIWDKIKAKQAQRALLVEKGIIQDNSEMPQTKETMMLNSGGLANLFRVKTQ